MLITSVFFTSQAMSDFDYDFSFDDDDEMNSNDEDIKETQTVSLHFELKIMDPILSRLIIDPMNLVILYFYVTRKFANSNNIVFDD